jgi:ferredoxin
MSFGSDPFDRNAPSLPGLERIDAHEGAKHTNQKLVAIRIDYDLCDDTAACVAVCPEEVIDRRNGHSAVVKPEACTECWICVENCPSGAVEIM